MKNENLEKYKELKSGGKYYEILGVDEKTSYTEINEAFDELSKKFDPNTSKENGAEEIHKIINTAYDMLSDPEKRRGHHIKRMDEDIVFGMGLRCGAGTAILLDKRIVSVIECGIGMAILLLIVWAIAVIIIDAIVGIVGYALYYASAGSEINIVVAIIIGIFAGIAALIVNIVSVIIQIILVIIVCIILGIISGVILGPIGWVIGRLINNLKGRPIDVNKEVAWLDSMPSPDTVDKKESEK